MSSFSRSTLKPLFLAATLALVLPAYASEPTTDECLAANERSITLRREFKLIAARKELVICAQSSCPAAIRDECSARVDEVSPAIPTVVFKAKDADGHDLTAVRIFVNGEPFADRLDGRPIAIDPGPHTFRFESKGGQLIEKKLVIIQGEKARHERIAFSRPATAPSHTLTERKARVPFPTIGIAAGGLGVVALGVGCVFGLRAKSQYDDSTANGHCNASNVCDRHGLDRRDAAFRSAAASTALFIAGGALVAGGATLYFVTKRPNEEGGASVAVTPLVTGGARGLLVHGSL